MKRLIFLFFIVFIFIFKGVSVDRIKVAILDFKGINVDEYIPKAVVEILSTALIDSGTFDIIERSQLEKVMSEMSLQSSDDFNENMAADIGNLLGAEVIIIGSVTQLGDRITVNMRGIEVSTGSAKFAKKITTDNINNLPEKLDDLVKMLTNTKRTTVVKNEKIPEKTPLTPVKLTPLKISGIGMTVGGGTLLAGGVVMLAVDLAVVGPNLDKIKLNAATYSYDEFQNAYNLYIGLFAGSIVLTAVGIGLTAGGIPLIVMKDKKTSLSFSIEPGSTTVFSFNYQF